MNPSMNPSMRPYAASSSIPGDTVDEWRAWLWLRRRYQEDLDLWTARELAHLRFLRWLAQNGRLAEDGYRPEVDAPPSSS
jgi:hypothetical protein